MKYLAVLFALWANFAHCEAVQEYEIVDIFAEVQVVSIDGSEYLCSHLFDVYDAVIVYNNDDSFCINQSALLGTSLLAEVHND